MKKLGNKIVMAVILVWNDCDLSCLLATLATSSYLIVYFARILVVLSLVPDANKVTRFNGVLGACLAIVLMFGLSVFTVDGFLKRRRARKIRAVEEMEVSN